MNGDEILSEVAAAVSNCEQCGLHFSRKKAVPGEGPSGSEIIFIGEGPGFYENEQGRPFVGPAGKFLDELLQQAGVRRDQVFIANVVKCRPPGNRDPLPEELAACAGFLDRQIEAINPHLIVTLGRFSMGKFLPNVKISDAHGQAAWVRGRLVVPMYHPAAALHQPSLKGTLVRDFARLPEYIQQAREKNPSIKDESHATRQAEPPPPATTRQHSPAQLSILPQPEKSTSQPETAEPETIQNSMPKQLSLF
jgi:uracil-DNA glycosylase